MNDTFLVQLLQPTAMTIEEELGQLLGFEIEAKSETRAKKPMSESLYDQAALTLYYTQPEIQARVDTVSEFASRSIRWAAKDDAQDEKMRAFWKKEMMRQKIEMMIANGFIFGRSVYEPFPSLPSSSPLPITSISFLAFFTPFQFSSSLPRSSSSRAYTV